MSHCFALFAGLRKAVGLNEARIGALSSVLPKSEGKIWDTGYIYKSPDLTVGWSPGTPEFTSYYSTRIELRLEGIHFLTGFLIQGCTLTRRCTPEVTSLRVWNRTLTKYGVYDVGPDQLIVYRDDQSVSTTCTYYYFNYCTLWSLSAFSMAKSLQLILETSPLHRLLTKLPAD